MATQVGQKRFAILLAIYEHNQAIKQTLHVFIVLCFVVLLLFVGGHRFCSSILFDFFIIQQYLSLEEKYTVSGASEIIYLIII